MSHPDRGLHWSHSHTGSTSGARFRASPGCRLLGRMRLKSWQRCWRRARPACTRRRAAGPRRRPGGARALPWTRACSACARASRRASGPGCESLHTPPSAAHDGACSAAPALRALIMHSHAGTLLHEATPAAASHLGLSLGDGASVKRPNSTVNACRPMLLGRPEGLSPEAGARMMDRARACVNSTLGTRADASPALLEALGTLMQGCDAQGEARMAQGVQQLCSAAGSQLIDAQGRKLGAELRYRFCILRLEMLVSMALVVSLSIIACNFGLGMY